jgi:hypothetical protein
VLLNLLGAQGGFLLTMRATAQVMESNILDFSAWEDDGKFGNTSDKLIDGLKLFYKNK